MSWNPFNKLIAPKKSSIKAVDDAEFDAQVQQVVVAENLSKKLYKNTKKCLESSISLSKLEQRIAYELFNSSKLIKDSEHLVEHTEMLKDVAAQIEDSQQQRDAIIRQTFVRPIKGLCEKFPTIHSAVKRREQSQQDYIKYFSRKEKLSRDPNSMQSGKFDANEKYLDRTRSDHERRTKQLSEDIPKFLHQKCLYFDPCFKAMLQSNQRHNETLKCLFDQLNSDFCDNLPSTEQEFKNTTDKMLEDIQALSIVKAK